MYIYTASVQDQKQRQHIMDRMAKVLPTQEHGKGATHLRTWRRCLPTQERGESATHFTTWWGCYPLENIAKVLPT